MQTSRPKARLSSGDQPARPARRRQAGSVQVQSLRVRSPAQQALRRGAYQQTAKVPTGGTVTWALEQDPGCIARSARSSRSTTGERDDVRRRSLEWDPKLNIRPALADELHGRQLEADRLEPPQGRQVPQRPGADGRRRRLLVPADAEPAAAGQRPRRARAGARRSQTSMRLSQVRGADGPEGAGRPRLRLLAWGRYSSIVPEQHVPEPQPGRRRASAPARSC